MVSILAKIFEFDWNATHFIRCDVLTYKHNASAPRHLKTCLLLVLKSSLSKYSIEEGFIQKTRQTVVVSVWGARSCAALGIFGLNVRYCVHYTAVTELLCFTLYFCWGVGGWGGGGVGRGDFVWRFVFWYLKFKDRFNYFIYYFIC